MPCLVFDDRGEAWEGLSDLARALNASIRGEALISYAIKNLGFIAASIANDSVHVRMRPAVVSQVALGNLLYWLHDQRLDRAMLSFFDQDWSHEILRSRDQVVERVLSRAPFKADDRDGDFLRQVRSPSDLTASDPLRGLLNAWSAQGSKFDREALDQLLDRALKGRFVLFEAAPGSSAVYVKDVGRGLGQSGNYWLTRTKGLKVEDQPDYAYGKWVAATYREALDKNEPVLDDVDAVISWPQQPRTSYRYRRLVVPFEGTGSSSLLLSATVIDPDICLRVKSG